MNVLNKFHLVKRGNFYLSLFTNVHTSHFLTVISPRNFSLPEFSPQEYLSCGLFVVETFCRQKLSTFAKRSFRQAKFLPRKFSQMICTSIHFWFVCCIHYAKTFCQIIIIIILAPEIVH